MSDIDFLSAYQRAAIARSMGAADSNPDDAARALDLSRDSGVPPIAIHNNLEEYEKKFKDIVGSNIIQGNPHIQDYLNSHPMAAHISNDDLGQLDKLSGSLDKFGLVNPLQKAAEAYKFYTDQLGVKSPIIEAGKATMESPIGAALEKFTGTVISPFQNIDDWIRENREGLKPFVQPEYAGMPWFLTPSGLPTSPEEAAQQAMGVKATALLPVAAAFGLGAGASEALKQSGAPEWVYEKPNLAAELLMRPEVGAFLTLFVAPAVPEIAFPYILSSIGRMLPWIESGKMPPPGAHPLTDKVHAEQAKRDSKAMNEVLADADKTNTGGQRSPEMLARFVGIKTGDQKVAIPLDAVRRLYGDTEPSFEDGKLGGIRGFVPQWRTAMEAGGDIEIPTKDWITVPKEVRDELHDDVRLRGVESMNLNEANDPKVEEALRDAIAAVEETTPRVGPRAAVRPGEEDEFARIERLFQEGMISAEEYERLNEAAFRAEEERQNRIEHYDRAFAEGRISIAEHQGFMEALGEVGREPRLPAPEETAREAFEQEPYVDPRDRIIDRVKERTQGLSDADKLESDETWYATRRLVEEEGWPIRSAFEDVAAEVLGRELTERERRYVEPLLEQAMVDWGLREGPVETIRKVAGLAQKAKQLTLKRQGEPLPAYTLPGRPPAKNHIFNFIDENGQFRGYISITEEGTDLYVNMVHGTGMGMGRSMLQNLFGPGLVRGLLRQLRAEFPEAKTISGLRVSGARGEAATTGHVKVPIRAAMAGDFLRDQLFEGFWVPFGDTSVKVTDFWTKHEQEVVDKVNKFIEKAAPRWAEAVPALDIEMEGYGRVLGAMEPRVASGRSLIAYVVGDPERGEMSIAREEVGHHLWAYFMYPHERKIARQAAIENRWLEKHDINRLYKGAPLDHKLEEAVMHEFADFRKKPEDYPKGPLADIFWRIYQFLEDIRREVGKVFREYLGRDPTYEDLFLGIEKGQIGRRRGVSPEDRAIPKAAVGEPPEGPPGALTMEDIRKAIEAQPDKFGVKLPKGERVSSAEFAQKVWGPVPTEQKNVISRQVFAEKMAERQIKKTRQAEAQVPPPLSAEERMLRGTKNMSDREALESEPFWGFVRRLVEDEGWGFQKSYDYASFSALGRELTPAERLQSRQDIAAAKKFWGYQEPTPVAKEGKVLPFVPKPRAAVRRGDSPFGPGAIGRPQTTMERIQRLIAKRGTEDAERMYERAEKEARKRQTAEWKEEAAKLRPEVEREIDSRPDMAAANWLRGHTFRLRSDRLTDRQKEVLPRNWHKKDGYDPDVIAQAFGYNTGEEMLNQLAALEARRGDKNLADFRKEMIDREVNRQMEAKRGKGLEESIIEEAQDHVLSPTQMDLLHEQTLLMGEEAGQKLPFSKQDIIENVKRTFGQMPASAIRVSRFLTEAGRAWRGIEDELMKGNFLDAFRLQQEQYYAAVKAREAVRFEKEQKKLERVFKRFKKRSVDGVPQDYTDFIHDIMLRIDRQVNRTPEDLALSKQSFNYTDIASFIKDKEESLWGMKEVPIADFLLQPDWKKPFDELTVDEYRGIAQSIHALVKQGREEGRYIALGKDLEIKDVRGKLLDEVKTFPLKEYPLEKGKLRKGSDYLRAFLAASTNVETFSNRMSRANPRGAWNRFVVRPLTEAANYKDKLIRQFSKMYKELGEPKDMGKMIDSPFRDPMTVDESNPDGRPFSHFTRAHGLQIINNMGNEYNFNVMAQGYKTSPETLRQWVWDQAAKGNFTKDDFDRAQKLGNIFSMIFKMAERVYQNLNGVAPERITLKPIDTPFGQYKGWYHPLVEDPLRSERAKPYGAYDDRDFGHAFIANGYTKRRTGAIYPLSLQHDAIPIRMQQMVHDIAFREAITNVQKLLREPELRSEITKRYGEHYGGEALLNYLKGIAGSEGIDSKGMAMAANLSNYFRANAIGTYIGFNPFTALKHGPTAATYSMRQVGPMNWIKATLDIYRKPEGMTEANKAWIDETFEEVGRRKRHWEETFAGAHKAITGKSTWRDWMLEKGSGMVAYSDMVSVRGTALAAYRKAMAELEAAGEHDHGQAVFEANRAVRFAHGSTAVTNLPEIIRKSGPFTSWMTTLFGFFGTTMQRRIEVAHQLNDAYHLAKGGKINEAAGMTGTALTNFMVYYVIPTYIEEQVTGLTTEDKKGWLHHLIAGSLLGLSSSVLFVRDVANSFIHGKEPTLGLLPSPLQEVARLGRDIGKGSKMFDRQHAGKTIQDLLTVVGVTTGMFPKHLAEPVRFGVDWYNRQQHPRTVGEYLRGLASGQAQKRQVP